MIIEKKIVGLIGYGRLGRVIFKNITNINKLLVADKDPRKLKKISNSDIIKKSTVETIFKTADVVLLIIPPREIITMVSQFANLLKTKTIVISFATGLRTNKIKTSRRDIDIIGLKLVGQFYAISKGVPGVFITETKKKEIRELLNIMFKTIGNIIYGDENIAAIINDLATREALKFIFTLSEKIKNIINLKEIISAAIKNVAAGTIMDYPCASDNEYINKRIKLIFKAI